MRVESGREAGPVAGAEEPSQEPSGERSDDNRGAHRIWPIADTQATIDAWDFAIIWPTRAIRVGALLLIASQLTFLFVDLHLVPEAAHRTLPLHLLNIAVGAILLSAAGSRALIRRWRESALLILAVLIVSTNAIGCFGGQREPLFIAVLLAVVGAGTCLPWSTAWQVSLELLGVVSLASSSLVVPTSFNQWLAIAVAIALAHWSNELSRRNRAEISKGLKILDATQAALRAKVVELEQSERRARESEEVLRKIIETCPDPMAINSLEDGRFIDINRAFMEASGLSREEVLGRPVDEFWKWANMSVRDELARSLLDHLAVRNMEADFRGKDGQRSTWLISAVATELGGKPSVVSICHDITELKEAEQKVRESESVLRKIIETCPDPIAINSLRDGTFTDINRAFQEASGFSREELLGKPVGDLWIWSDMSVRDELLRRLRDHSAITNMEADFRGKDGRRSTGLISAVVTELGGKPSVVSIIRDITELKDAEQKVRESEAVLRKIIETCPDPIGINLLKGGQFVDVNPAWVAANGYAREEVLGKSALEVGIWADASYREEFLKRLRADSVVRNMEIELRRKDGGCSPYLTSAVLTELGGKPSIISIGRDITELKQTEQQLRAAREVALAAARAKSEFLSSMSHEIRTPMNAVLGMAELLWDSPLSPEQRRYVNVMRANGDALVDLINDILDLAKIESGCLSLERVGFDLDDLVDKLGEMMGIRAHEKGLELALRVAPGVPTNLIGDPLRLRQILVNLLGNAIKFTERGEVVLSIERAEPASAGGSRNGASGEVKLRFSVRDTGIGIAKDKLGLIFTSFAQADLSIARTFGGTGLGLSISERLAELFGGKISVESEPGVGSCFSFTASLGIGKAHAKAAPRGARDLTGLRVLVVDDIEVNRLILKEILERKGAVISEARSGAEALARVERAAGAGEPYQLIILDCRMPGMDGIEVARVLKASHEGVRREPPLVVMLTSDDLKITPALLGELGIHTYLVKPVRRAELLDVIGRALRDERVPESARTDSRANAVAGGPANLRVLLADDSRDNRLLVRAYMAKTGWELDEAKDGAGAIEKFKAGKYDLVLMDMLMPAMDGFAATKAIREWEQQNHLARTPIIALTASALPETVHECIEAGCDSHVSKPVSRAMLFDAIRDAAARKQANGSADGVKTVVTVEEGLRTLVPDFLEHKRAAIAEALKALQHGDCASALRVGHQLKGEGGAYGFWALTELGGALEEAARSNDLEGASRRAGELADFLNHVEVEYQP